MIDIERETILTFSQAAKRLPRLRGNRPVSPCTLWRWATHGLRGIRLGTIKCGGTTVTSSEELTRFFARLSGEPEPTPPAPATVEDRMAAAGVA